MDFKLKEHSLIWENYMTRFGSQDDEDTMIDDYEDNDDQSYGYDDDDDNIMDDDSGGVIMSFDTSEPVEVDHDDSHDDHDDYETDERNDMIRSEIKKLEEFASRLSEMTKDADFEEWMAAKITKAADYVSDVYFRLSTKADYANHGCGCGD